MVGQPAEETGTGAMAMLEDGLFTRFPGRIASWASMSVRPCPQEGRLQRRATMAGCASLDLRIRGVGGHGSRPHEVKFQVMAPNDISCRP
jgi:hippurate hydrolase